MKWYFAIRNAEPEILHLYLQKVTDGDVRNDL